MVESRGVYRVLVGKEVTWGDPVVDGRIILRWFFRKWDVGGSDWIELAQERDRWRARVIGVMTFRVP
jgi:hypothetical protein